MDREGLVQAAPAHRQRRRPSGFPPHLRALSRPLADEFAAERADGRPFTPAQTLVEAPSSDYAVCLRRSA